MSITVPYKCCPFILIDNYSVPVHEVPQDHPQPITTCSPPQSPKIIKNSTITKSLLQPIIPIITVNSRSAPNSGLSDDDDVSCSGNV